MVTENVGLNIGLNDEQVNRGIDKVRGGLAGLGSQTKGLAVPFLAAAAVSGVLTGKLGSLAKGSGRLDNSLLSVNKQVTDLRNATTGKAIDLFGPGGVQIGSGIGDIVSKIASALTGTFGVILAFIFGEEIKAAITTAISKLAPKSFLVSVALRVTPVLAVVGFAALVVKALREQAKELEEISLDDIFSRVQSDWAAWFADPFGLSEIDAAQTIRDFFNNIIQEINSAIGEINKVLGIIGQEIPTIPLLEKQSPALLAPTNPVLPAGDISSGSFGEHENYDQGVPVIDVKQTIHVNGPVDPEWIKTLARRRISDVLNDPVTAAPYDIGPGLRIV